MERIYMDESGYTGYDLLNTQQPFQGASSVNINEESAKALIDEYFPRNRAQELKHKSLSRRENNWDALLGIQNRLLKDHMGFTYICDKRYLLILMFLDSCVEPFFNDQGMDFYEDGHNYALGSVLYYTAPTLWGSENFEGLLSLFQQANRSKSDVGIQALAVKAKFLLGREMSENLFPIATEYQSCVREIKEPDTNTDAALVILLSLITHIEKYIFSSYEIVHDTSNNLCRYNEIINWFINMDDTKVFKGTAKTSLSFPLKLSAVKQADSRNSLGVQLTDILIGGAIESAKAHAGLVEKNDYNQKVLGLYGDSNLIHLVPSLDFEQQKEFYAGSQAEELIDFISSGFNK